MKSSVSGETDSTIDFELSEDELAHPLDGLHASCPFTRASTPPIAAGRPLDRAPSPRLPGRGIALAVSVTLAVLLLGLAKHRTSKPVSQPPHSPTAVLAHETTAPEIVSTSASKPVPVRLANPFDATEVFEFPAGTSLEYARESVAELLLDRARNRHVRHKQRPRNRRELRNS